VAALHVPEVEPAGTSQVVPPQQSAVTVQAAPAWPQSASHWWVVALQESEQQFESLAQVAPFAVHMAQVPFTHAPGPAQQGVPPEVQVAPSAVHVVSAVQT
jgi:hypothetical protein